MFCLRSSDVISTNDSSRHGEGIDLPSPASSTVESDTSDYPRSTPSPRDHDSGIGSLEEFSYSSKDTDPGLGDELILVEEPSDTRKETCINNNDSRDDVLGKVRVALEKFPSENVKAEDCAYEGKKRLSSNGDDGSDLYDRCGKSDKSGKRLKLEIHDVGSQGKITEYLSEMKHFKALRKEKLDRVLNLKTEDKQQKHHQQEVTQLLEAVVKKEEEEVTTAASLLISEELLDEHSAVGDETESSERLKGEEKEKSSHQFEVPKAVVRFPSRNSGGIQCRWESCGQELESSGKLIDHLKTKHASLQMKEDVQKYKCLWEGCKVYGKISCSKSWLEKHLISHGGNKPFQCIVDGCKQRFSTQSLLERHVNSHFKSSSLPHNPNNIVRKSCDHSSSSSSTSSSHSSASSSGSSTPKVLPKVIKKAGRKLKYRKTIFSARLFDLFDIGIMAQVQERLVHIERNSLCGVIQDRITFTGSIIAKKRDESGKVLFLMRWSPQNLLADEWVEKACVSSSKTLRICSLPESSKEFLSTILLAQNTPSFRNKRKFNPQRSRS